MWSPRWIGRESRRWPGYRSTRALLVDATRIAPARAGKLVARAQAVAETLTPTGHVTPAPLPTVRAALVEGLIDGEHIDARHRLVVVDPVLPVPVQQPQGARLRRRSTLPRTPPPDPPQ